MNMNKSGLFVILGIILMPNAFGDANDNEIFIAQTGDNVELTIQQIGAGNKYGGDDFSGTSADMIMTVSNSYLDLKDYSFITRIVLYLTTKISKNIGNIIKNIHLILQSYFLLLV